MKSMKNKNRAVTFAISVLMIVSMSAPAFAASSNAPEINEFQVQDRLTKLIKNYKGTYFTTTKGGVYGKKDPHGATYHRFWFCKYCTVNNVVRSNKIRREYPGGINVNNMPKHHNFDWRVWFGGDSCCGFATYAGFYTFANGQNKNVVGEPKFRYYYNASSAHNMRRNLRAGDMIRFDSSHSSIYLGDINSNGMLVIDSNYWYTSGGTVKGVCQVRVHRIPFSHYSKIGVTRGGNAVNVPLRKPNVTKSGRGAKLTWKKVSGADSYIVYRSTNPRSGFSSIGTTGEPAFYDKGINTEKKYYYKTRSVNSFNGRKYYSGYSSSGTWK